MAMKARSSGFLLPMPVWDVTTRLFHWLSVVVFAISYISVTIADGPNAALWMRIHVASGETMLGLLLFRIVWGLIGSDTARFARFLRSPSAALRHLRHLTRREPDLQVGHNEAGGWMVVLMLLLLGVQVGTGLFANDDGSSEGPLAQFVSKPMSDQLSAIHSLNFDILVGAVGVHIAAIVIYAVLKRQNLLRPMITGKKRLPAATRAPHMAHPLLAAVTLAVVASVTVLISRL
jgi:cytochrome b